MGAVAEAKSVCGVKAGSPSAVRDRLEAFAGEVLAEAMNRPVQAINGGLYLRGLLEQGSQVGCSGVMPALVDEVGGGSGLGERDHLRGGVAARVHAGASP